MPDKSLLRRQFHVLHRSMWLLLVVSWVAAQACFPLVLGSANGESWKGWLYDIVSVDTGVSVKIGTFEEVLPLVNETDVDICLEDGLCYTFEIRLDGDLGDEEPALRAASAFSWDFASGSIVGNTPPFGPVYFRVTEDTIEDTCTPTSTPTMSHAPSVSEEPVPAPSSPPSLRPTTLATLDPQPRAPTTPEYSDLATQLRECNPVRLQGVLYVAATLEVVGSCAMNITGGAILDGGGDGTADGGGVRLFLVSSGALRLSSLVLRGGHDFGRGGGMLVTNGGRAMLSNVTFESCYARYGAGLFAGDNSWVWARDAVFEWNLAEAGAAAYATTGSVLDFGRVVARDNIADFRHAGPNRNSPIDRHNESDAGQCGAAFGVLGTNTSLRLADSFVASNYIFSYSILVLQGLPFGSDESVLRQGASKSRHGCGAVCANYGAELVVKNSILEDNTCELVSEEHALSVEVDLVPRMSITCGISVNFEATAVVDDCEIRGNIGGALSAGFFAELDASNTVVVNNLGNDAGAVTVHSYASARLFACTIAFNTANIGGGLHAYNGNATIVNSTIMGNTAYSRGAGMQFYLGSIGRIADCVVINNAAGIIDGGIGVRLKSEVTVERTLVANNSASWMGGGIGVEDSTLAVVNSTFAGNTADFGPGTLVEKRATASFVSTIFVSNFARGTGAAAMVMGASVHFDDVVMTENVAILNSVVDLCKKSTDMDALAATVPATIVLCEGARADITGGSEIVDNNASALLLDKQSLAQLADTRIADNKDGVLCGPTSSLYAARLDLDVPATRIDVSSTCTAVIYQANGIGSTPDILRNATSSSTGAVSLAWWTWPCKPGTTSSDGLQHGDHILDVGNFSINHNDPFCDPYSNECPSPCSTCPGGRYVSFTLDRFRLIGDAACSECPIGRAARESPDPSLHDELDDCQLCPPGKATATVGSASCSSCEDGHFTNESGSASCRPAAPGFFTTDGVHESPCPPGSFSVGGASKCSACSPASYTTEFGSTACLVADPGHFVSSAGCDTQHECPAGKWSGSAATECT